MKNIKVVFFGTSDFVTQVLDKLHENFQVVGVVSTQNDSPVANRAHELNIPLVDPEKVEANLFVVASYGKIIPKSILEIPKFGALNIHPSLLPKFRGPTPIQTAILEGVKTSGVSIIKMDEEVDHGPILTQEELELTSSDNFQTLSKRMFQLGASLIVSIIPDFLEGKVELKLQYHDTATFTSHMSKMDGYFPIDTPPSSEVLDKMVRAYYPWPTAWTKWKDKIVKFLPDKRIQMEGKNPTDFKSFLNGYPEFPLKIWQ